MKKIFRFSGLALLAALFVGVGASATFAQEACADTDGQTALYTEFTTLYPKTDLPSRKAAIEKAKQFLEKYGACEALKEQVDYFKTAVPALEKAVKDAEDRGWLSERLKRFDAAVQANNADETLAAGKEILTKQPDNINFILAMALVASGQSTAANNYKYADDGLRYANLALSKINSGAEFTKTNPSKTEKTAGVYWTERTKTEAISDLKYSVAYLTYFGKKDKATALPLFYDLSQGAYKDNPLIYGIIGDYYVEQRKPIAEQIRTKIAEQSAAGTTEERKIALEAEIKQHVALFNGYNERILDAYGRAYKVTKDTPANKAYRDNLYKIMQDVYKSRFDKDTGLNEYISATVAKPFPNPTSEVTPVSDPEPAKTTGSTTDTAQPTTTGAATGTTATTAKPAAAATNGKTATTTKPAATTNGKTATTGKPAATNGKTATTAKSAATNGKTASTTKPKR